MNYGSLNSQLIDQRISTMNAWLVQDVKARFSELLDACVSEGPQLVTRRGVETTLLVSVAEWKQLRNAVRPSLKELLLSASARSNLAQPVRSRCAAGRSAALVAYRDSH